MAITTLDQATASALPPQEILKAGATMEAAGVWHSLFYSAGRPGAAVAPSPGLAGAALTTYAGQIPFTNPASGNTNMLKFSASASATGSLLLLDRLWHNSGFTVTTTTAQTVTSAAWPARCVPSSGSTPDTNGGGIMVGIEVSAATTNAGAVTNMTLSYTNQAGTAGQTATIPSTVPGGGFPATAAAGTFVPFQLAAGDTGVRAIASLTLGTSLVTGTVHLVAYRKLAQLSITTANVSQALDFLTSGAVRLYDNSVPFLVWIPTATTATTVAGDLIYTQG